jgi:hypothetical protein
MKRIALAVVLALLGGAGCAQPLDGAEFGAYAEGWTLHFERDGAPFGAESFDGEGNVVWKPEGGDCERGVWGHDGERICFLYPGALACWRVERSGDVLIARAEDARAFALRITRRDRAPLLCDDGPNV